ncbi:integrase-like protein [Halopolyspora algeriensis]|uniref:Integrase-like protein n=1 Tax=Halopolyspora algeriensis TaxID=1500506 RepID=A0A368VB69_9ACTN|nr:site-specific integrase [Halopolyspora algeriensis]RCW37485.1 integrase-like protein [Halopolyspora algeriensis]TQM46224.1 integrase-like protein [Halopolyspora algeriensis]
MPRKRRKEGTRAPNRTSSVYFSDKDGYWHGRVTMGVRDDGTPDRRHVKRKDEAECRRKVRELENERDAGKVRKPGRAWTVEKWLTYWVENIASPTVRQTTMVGYRTSVYKHLVPGIGKHRIDQLQPEHLERLYVRMQKDGLKPGTAHLVHRTVRAALNEAVRRRHILENPAKVAKPPRVEEEEIEPFTVDEARRVLSAAADMRNGARFVIALTLGLRRGEALGLKWSDITVTWKHGCPKSDPCRRAHPAEDCGQRQGSGTLTIRRSLQTHTWQHGCSEDKPCEHRYGAHCPHRHGGGIVVSEVKSRAGRRTIGLPQPVIESLEEHRARQEFERKRAREAWEEGGWVFTNRWGSPVHTTVDYDAWKALLRAADVRNARLHDARHTAATMLLVLKVPLRAVMEIMGWSEASMAQRYMHVPHELVTAVADQVGGLMWPESGTDDDEDDDGEAGSLVPA